MFLRILLLLLLFSEVAPLTAQQHFIYIQSADGKPFYIKTNNKTYNSSGSGYVVIPKLISGRYMIDLGRADAIIPEQRFFVSLTDKDLGLRLRSVNGSWELADLHSDMRYVAETRSEIIPDQSVQTSDPFTRLLSQVVSDPELLKKEKDVPVAAKTPEPDIVSVENKGITPVADSSKVVLKQAEVRSLTNSEKSVVKISSSAAGGRLESVYLVDEVNISDTVSIIIENGDDSTLVKSSQSDSLKNGLGKKIDEKSSAPVFNTDSSTLKKAESLANVKNENAVLSAEAGKEKQKEILNAKSVHSFCLDSASTNEFIKLRKKMVAQPDEDQMVFAAKKYFRTGCFTTQQIRNLAVLFLQERTRFRFLEAASTAVYDRNNLSTLESLLTEKDYITAFRNLIKTN